MRRTILLSVLVATLLSTANWAQAQIVLAVDGGFALSKQYGSQLNLLPTGKISAAGGLAVEYLRLSNVYLRSGLSYKAVGGEDTQNVPFSSKKGGHKAQETFHLLQLNTVVRTAFRTGITEFYLGFGPKVDFLMGKPAFKEKLFSDYKVKPALFGFLYEVGLDFWLANDKYKVGFRSCFEHDATAFAKAKGNDLYNQNLSVQLNFGLRIGGKKTAAALQAE